ncbi:hypothetical protein EV178_005427 [Coemansia sp. RSA 1646]|nr:hypothetical protein EV178_005427 [Coemansia sp. RSA 1646]KAJ2086758.1 hypothetical protein IW138_005436 [Coemansia sp. RSA 986]
MYRLDDPPQLPSIAHDMNIFSAFDDDKPLSHAASWHSSIVEIYDTGEKSICSSSPPPLPASNDTIVEPGYAECLPCSSAAEDFAPSWKAWMCALMFTTMFAFISPVFLFRAYTMPVTPLLIPVFLYLLCQLSNGQQMVSTRNTSLSKGTELISEHSNVYCKWYLHSMRRFKAFLRACLYWRPDIGSFSRQEVAWITSMVAAGGSFAPAYQWIATIDSDYGHLLSHWQQLAVVLGTQLLGWSLGQMLNRVFVGRSNKAPWPDTLPLSFLIQTLFPTPKRCYSQQQRQQPDNHCRLTENADVVDSDITRTNTQLFDKRNDEKMDRCSPIFRPKHSLPSNALAGSDSQKNYEPKDRLSCHSAPDNDSAHNSNDMQAVTITRKRTLALLTSGTFAYHIILSYIVPIFKSFCLLCFANPSSRILGSLGSGWNGTGILSVTFDWAAITSLQPFVTPFWAQIHYLLGAVLMLYILTPVGWRLDWWESSSLPIVSTNVFDITGSVYNITVVDQLGANYRQGPQRVYDPYSPVRLTVNSALAYIVSVAATAAVIMHLALWHSQWSLQAVTNMAQSLVRLWDPRPLFRTSSSAREDERCSRKRAVSDLAKRTGGAVIGLSKGRTHDQTPSASWNIKYVGSRVGRMLIFTASLGIAVVSSQLGITTLPGWQALLAAVWAMLMCIPLGFVEAMTGFTLPMDLLPHIFAGWMDGPGHPIENGYFHLWATVPVRVALGWSGVRGFQLVYSSCFAESRPRCTQQQKRDTKQPTPQLPWMKRGLLIGLVWGACVNHISYTAFSNSLEQTQIILPPSPADKAESSAADMTPTALGWHEEGEFGRLPAALSSELVVWGIVGPKSLFSANSPYRMLFLYGALVGVFAPLAQFTVHRLLVRLAKSDAAGRRSTACRRMAGQLAYVAKSIEIPLVLTGMVAVPTIPANFIISGLVVAVVAHIWCKRRSTTLVDRSLYNAAMDTGARLAVAVLFAVGQILATQQKALTFASWWGNRVGNVEQCDTRRTTGNSGF